MILPSSHHEAGFTLIEMMVVIAVMGLIIGILAASGPPRSHWLAAEGAAQQVAAAMKSARGRAIASGRPVAFAMPRLPAWLGVTVAPALGNIVFDPDDSSSGGQVTLSVGSRRIEIAANWLTARVSVHEP